MAGLALDAEMKCLAPAGKAVRQQAQPISVNEEERLWQLGPLGNDSAQVLGDRMVF